MRQVRQHEAGSPRHAGAEGRGRQRCRARVKDAQILQLARGNLQDFQFQHDLGLGNIDGGHELFGHAHRIRRVTENHRRGALVDEQSLGAQDRFQHGLDFLRLRVREVESPDHLLLVLLLLVGIVGVDHHHVGGEDLARQGTLIEHQIDSLLDCHVLDEYGGLAVALDVLVENEVDAGLARQHFEHHLGGRIAELQRHFAVVPCFQAWRDRRRPTRGGDLGGQILRGLEARILREDDPQLRFRRVVILAFEVLAGRGDRGALARVAIEHGEPAVSAVVGRVDHQHAPIGQTRGIELSCGPGAIRDGDQPLDRLFASCLQIQTIAYVARVAADRLAELRNADLVVPSSIALRPSWCSRLAAQPAMRPESPLRLSAGASVSITDRPRLSSCCFMLRGL